MQTWYCIGVTSELRHYIERGACWDTRLDFSSHIDLWVKFQGSKCCCERGGFLLYRHNLQDPTLVFHLWKYDLVIKFIFKPQIKKVLHPWDKNPKIGIIQSKIPRLKKITKSEKISFTGLKIPKSENFLIREKILKSKKILNPGIKIPRFKNNRRPGIKSLSKIMKKTPISAMKSRKF